MWLRLPPASFSVLACEARQDKMGGEGDPHWHAAEHRRGCRKGDLHCLSEASLQSPGSIEEHRASRQRLAKGHRVPFLWFVSLGKQRNEQENDWYSDKNAGTGPEPHTGIWGGNSPHHILIILVSIDEPTNCFHEFFYQIR